MNNNSSNIFSNKLFTIIVIPFVITIIGAAIWDFFLADVLEHLYQSILTLLGPLAQKYVDSIYSNAASGMTEEASYMLLTSAYGIVYAYFISAVSIVVKSTHKTKNEVLALHNEIINHKGEISDLDVISLDSPPKEPLQESKTSESYDLVKKTTKRYRFVLFVLVFLIFGCIINFNYIIKSNIACSIRCKTLTNIDIVAPYISDNQYKQFKSVFYLIETEDDYIALEQDLSDIATTHHLKLKK